MTFITKKTSKGSISLQISLLIFLIYLFIHIIISIISIIVYFFGENYYIYYIIIYISDIIEYPLDVQSISIIHMHIMLILLYTIFFSPVIFIIKFYVELPYKIKFIANQLVIFKKLIIKFYYNSFYILVRGPILMLAINLLSGVFLYSNFFCKYNNIQLYYILIIVAIIIIISTAYLILSKILDLLDIENFIFFYASKIIYIIISSIVFIYISLFYISPILVNKFSSYFIAEKKISIIIAQNFEMSILSSQLFLYCYYSIFIISILYINLYKNLKMLFIDLNKKDISNIKVFFSKFIYIILVIIQLSLVLLIVVTFCILYLVKVNKYLEIENLSILLTHKKTIYCLILVFCLYLAILLPFYFLDLIISQSEKDNNQAHLKNYIQSKYYVLFSFKTILKAFISSFLYVLLFSICIYILTIYFSLNMYPTKNWFFSFFSNLNRPIPLLELYKFTFSLFFLLVALFYFDFIENLTIRASFEPSLDSKDEQVAILLILVKNFFVFLWKSVFYFIIIYIFIRVNFYLLDSPYELSFPINDILLKSKGLNVLYSILIYPFLFYMIILDSVDSISDKYVEHFIPKNGYFFTIKDARGIPIEFPEHNRNINSGFFISEAKIILFYILTFICILVIDNYLFNPNIFFLGKGALDFFIPLFILFYFIIKELIFIKK